MNSAVDKTPCFALIDDDQHSAYLLVRMLLAHGAPRIEVFTSAADAAARLYPRLASHSACPTMVIVDLKCRSAANLEFVTELAPVARILDVPVAVLAQHPDRQQISDLHDAGAAGVFTRHADRDAYRREAASIVSFWARSQRLDAVGM